MQPTKENIGFNVYRGLQRPLIFKSLKGKYIYWGVGTILGAFLSAIVLSVTVNYFVGFAALLGVALGGLGWIAKKQKGGLHSKTKSSGVFIIQARFQKNYRAGTGPQ